MREGGVIKATISGHGCGTHALEITYQDNQVHIVSHDGGGEMRHVYASISLSREQAAFLVQILLGMVEVKSISYEDWTD